MIGWVLLTTTQMLAGSVVECAVRSSGSRVRVAGSCLVSSVVKVLPDPGFGSTFATLDGDAPPPETAVTPPTTSTVATVATAAASVVLTST